MKQASIRSLELKCDPDEERKPEFSTLIDHIPLGIFRLKPTPGYPLAFVNRNLALMLGYQSASEMIGARARDFLPPSTDLTHLKNELFTRDSLTNYEIPLIRKDGSAVPTMITAKVQYAADHSLAHIDHLLVWFMSLFN